MLLVYGAAIAAACVCLFVFLFELGRARAFPVWMETLAILDILIVSVVAGFTFALALPVAFFVDLSAQSFGTFEAVALAAALALGAGACLAGHRLARRITSATGRRTATVTPPAPANDTTPATRGRTGRRARRRAA